MEPPTFPTDVLIHLSLASFPGPTQLSVTVRKWNQDRKDGKKGLIVLINMYM